MGRPKMSEEEKLAARQKRELVAKQQSEAFKEIKSDSVESFEQKANPYLNTNQATANLPVLKQVAYSIAKDKDTGRWYVIKIMYDLISGAVSSPVKLGEGDDRSIAFERFKIEAGTAFMGDL